MIASPFAWILSDRSSRTLVSASTSICESRRGDRTVCQRVWLRLRASLHMGALRYTSEHGVWRGAHVRIECSITQGKAGSLIDTRKLIYPPSTRLLPCLTLAQGLDNLDVVYSSWSVRTQCFESTECAVLQVAHSCVASRTACIRNAPLSSACASMQRASLLSAHSLQTHPGTVSASTVAASSSVHRRGRVQSILRARCTHTYAHGCTHTYAHQPYVQVEH